MTNDLSTAQDSEFLQRSVVRALASVGEGGGPFGAVVVRGAEVVAVAANRVTLHCDPTAHAEVEALRQAGARLGRPWLEDCVLYASCQPCPMCLAASLWARVQRVVYAATQLDAAEAGFDDRAFARRLYGQDAAVALPEGYLERLVLPEAVAPFRAWRDKSDREVY